MDDSIKITEETDINLYRPNAGIIVVNREGKVLSARRNDVKIHAWQMPQGGIDEGEDILAAARRELFEETGIPKEDVELIAIHPDWLKYDWAKVRKDGIVGQRQKWFLFHYKGDDSTIDVTKVSEVEFDEWKWADVDTVISEAVDFRKPIYEAVFETFKNKITHPNVEKV